MAREGSAPIDGLDWAAAWARLAVLMSLRGLPQVEAARIPLRALPPNRVRVLNPPRACRPC
jgi:hypothetical protein